MYIHRGMLGRLGTAAGLTGVLIAAAVAQSAAAPIPQQSSPPAAAATSADPPSSKAVDRLVDELRKHPAPPSRKDGQVGLFLIDVAGGRAVRIANEPVEGLNQCGSPVWSHDGRRIAFDATPGTPGKAEFSRSRIRTLELDGDRLTGIDLGLGNCPDFAPADDRIVFLLNNAPNNQTGVWLMKADGSGRRMLGDYGRPRWSPRSTQFLIASFGTPTEVTIMDVRPENSGKLVLPDHQVFSVPSWAGDGTVVAAVGPFNGPADSIALIDATSPADGKIKEVLWKKGGGSEIQPESPVYSSATGHCVFIGKTPGKGRALYTLDPGRGKPVPARRLEPGDALDNLIQDPTFSPDGRYIVFSCDRKPPADAKPTAEKPAGAAKP
ncbi:MAG: TolB family protein [Isosphaeraceae bacterium]